MLLLTVSTLKHIKHTKFTILIQSYITRNSYIAAAKYRNDYWLLFSFRPGGDSFYRNKQYGERGRYCANEALAKCVIVVQDHWRHSSLFAVGNRFERQGARVTRSSDVAEKPRDALYRVANDSLWDNCVWIIVFICEINGKSFGVASTACEGTHTHSRTWLTTSVV